MAEFEIIRRENRIGRVNRKTHCKAIKLQSKYTYIEDLQLSRFDQPSRFSLSFLFSIQKENTKRLTFTLSSVYPPNSNTNWARLFSTVYTRMEKTGRNVKSWWDAEKANE